MTEELFRSDGYLRECDANVTAVTEVCDREGKPVAHGVVLNQTVFYPVGGGQPGDIGVMSLSDGSELEVLDTFKDRETSAHLHAISIDQTPPSVGDSVSVRLDWDRRHRLMRMHSAMHMLCAAIPAPVTGGSIQDGRGRLDFDLPDPVDKTEVTARLNELIALDTPMSLSWITDEELKENPDLVRTMSVEPPTGSGKVRLVNFAGVDYQPCGGTHVASSGEIGRVLVKKIEKKGKQNRRVIVVFDES